MLIGVVAFLQVYSIQSILPILQREFMASEVQVGSLVGATVLSVALLSPFLGMLSDAIGRRGVIIASIVFLAIPTGMIATGNNVFELTIWRFLQGVAVPGITVVTIAYIGEEYESSSIGQLMSYYVSGSVLGGFLGRFILGHLHEWIGWRWAYVVMAVLTIIGAVWVARTLPKSQHFVPNANLRASLKMLASHLQNRYVIAPSLLGFCVLFSLVGCFTFINLHLADPPYHLSTSDLANIFAVYLIGVIITPLSARLIAKLGVKVSIVLAVLLSAVGVIITLVHPLGWIIGGLALMSSGVFITQSATIGYIANNVTVGRSLASGLYYMSYYAGGTVGAWACGYAYTHGQWTWTVMTLLAVQAVALLIVIFGLQKRTPKPVG